MSISSLLHLCTILEQCDFKFLFTRRLNQDPLENLFSVMRLKWDSCDNPTSLDFARLLKQVCCCQLLQASVGSNCELDVLDVLATITTPLTSDKTCRTNCSIKKSTPGLACPVIPAGINMNDCLERQMVLCILCIFLATYSADCSGGTIVILVS